MAKYWFNITVWSGNAALSTGTFYGTADAANRAGAARAVEQNGDCATVVGEDHYRDIAVAD